MSTQEIVFRVNGKEWEATVSDREWNVIGMDRTGTPVRLPHHRRCGAVAS